MQPHQELQQAMLPAFDALDRLMVDAAAGARACTRRPRVARLLHGKAPIDFVAGPATPHAVLDDGPLARLLHYPAAKAGAQATPILIVASLINRYYVLDLLPELSVIALLARARLRRLRARLEGARRRRSRRSASPTTSTAPSRPRPRPSRRASVGQRCRSSSATAWAARWRRCSPRATPNGCARSCLLGTPIEFHASGAARRAGPTASRFDADLLMDVLGNMPPVADAVRLQAAQPVRRRQQDGAPAPRRRRRRARCATSSRSSRGSTTTSPSPAASTASTSARSTRTTRSCAAHHARRRHAGRPRQADRAAAQRDRAARPHLRAARRRARSCRWSARRTSRLLEFDTGHIGLTTSRRSLGELWPRIADWMERARVMRSALAGARSAWRSSASRRCSSSISRARRSRVRLAASRAGGAPPARAAPGSLHPRAHGRSATRCMAASDSAMPLAHAALEQLPRPPSGSRSSQRRPSSRRASRSAAQELDRQQSRAAARSAASRMICVSTRG